MPRVILILVCDFTLIVFFKIYTPKRTGKPIDEVKTAKDFEAFDKILGTIEKVFLEDKKYITSDEISIADICCLSEVANPLQDNNIHFEYLLFEETKLSKIQNFVLMYFTPNFYFLSQNFQNSEIFCILKGLTGNEI